MVLLFLKLKSENIGREGETVGQLGEPIMGGATLQEWTPHPAIGLHCGTKMCNTLKILEILLILVS
jgi:hypothetical protein